jgi:uncharacterized protein (TIGR02594 family)
MKHIVLPTALNVRAEPNTSAIIQAVLPRFAVVEEIEATPDRDWLKISAPGYRGWCANGYLIRQEMWSNPIAHLAAMEFGTGEVPGPRNSPRIVEYQNSIAGSGSGAGGDEVPWCSSFMHWCVKKHVGKAQKEIDASARSWKNWGQAVHIGGEVAPGCIAVLWRRDEKKDAGKTAAQISSKGASGHVALLAEPYINADKQITLLGGNQGSRVSKATYTLGTDYGLLGFRTL